MGDGVSDVSLPEEVEVADVEVPVGAVDETLDEELPEDESDEPPPRKGAVLLQV